MDSPILGYGSSSDLREESDCDLLAPADPPLMGPTSTVVEDDLAEWRRKYYVPSFVDLRVPTPEERASSYILGEIAVYEAFFDTGFGRGGVIHALVVGLCTLSDLEDSHSHSKLGRLGVSILWY